MAQSHPDLGRLESFMAHINKLCLIKSQTAEIL